MMVVEGRERKVLTRALPRPRSVSNGEDEEKQEGEQTPVTASDEVSCVYHCRYEWETLSP